MSQKKKHMLKLDSSLGKVRRRNSGFAAEEERRRKMVLYAGAVFVAVLVVMLAILGIGTVIAEIIAPDKVTASSAPDEKPMTDDDALILLTLKLSDDHKEVEQMVLARLDPIDGRSYVCGLSPRLTWDGRTLGEYFAQEGIEGVSGAVGGLMDCEDVFTLQVDYTSMRKVINIFGGATITVPYAIKYDSPNNDRNLNVAPGTREYTGWEIARLLNYPYWNGGEQEQLYMYAMVVDSIINENMYYTSSDQLKKVLSRLYEEAETDLTMTDYQLRSAGLLYLCSVNRELDEGEKLSVIVDIWPEEQPDGTLAYSEENLKNMRIVFGHRGISED